MEFRITSGDGGRGGEEVVKTEGRYSVGDRITEEEVGWLGEDDVGCEDEAEKSCNSLLLGTYVGAKDDDGAEAGEEGSVPKPIGGGSR
jgi:hypothetical protein